jgi:hypothetical protein
VFGFQKKIRKKFDFLILSLECVQPSPYTWAQIRGGTLWLPTLRHPFNFLLENFTDTLEETRARQSFAWTQ